MSEQIPTTKQERMRRVVELIQELQSEHIVHGHGTASERAAKDMLEHGLFTNHTVLKEFTHVLPNDASEIERQLQFWNYDNRKCVILVTVPKHPDYYNEIVARDGRDAGENARISAAFAKEHVFEEDVPEGDLTAPEGASRKIPTRMILGYWNSDTSEFVSNPNFEG